MNLMEIVRSLNVTENIKLKKTLSWSTKIGKTARNRKIVKQLNCRFHSPHNNIDTKRYEAQLSVLCCQELPSGE